ncbi:MAG TPA: helix-turn-helix transcriptional regulator [Nocardioides sp.]|uniref:ArsR/SmtB family transcription factor n=1 Tax=Nocardioides sp. TaxID=35761 RepID=UPI002E3365F5|nr:helix-turn-helix transcriptional regulator [Nocardioides sp.]HEX5089612.1 helix-turn-helix transcriptional regulator [Nocardioides sp.]
MVTTEPYAEVGGDVDISSVASLFADRTRASILSALADGRALAASVLADEAGVSAPAASAQLGKLTRAGLIDVEVSGRHRYYSLASDHVATVIEALSALAPRRPVRSLREGTRAAALRRARTCYDHLAGRYGCAVTQGLVDRGVLVAGDGIADTRRRESDPLSAQLHEHPYELGPDAGPVLEELGVDIDAVRRGAGQRPLLRFCLDWSEQRHHLAGRLGSAVLDASLAQGWVVRRPGHRAVTVTDAGEAALSRLRASS